MTGHCKGNYQNKPNDVDPGARLLRVAINSEIKHKVPNLQDPAYKREQQSLTFNYTVKELTVEQLLYEEIAKRHNFTAVFWNSNKKCFHRNGKYFVSSDLLVFDFDNSTYIDDPTDPEKKRKTKVKYDDLRYWTIERALAHPFIKKYAALLYTTNSHTEEWHKFRVGFITPETITKRDTYEMFLRAGIQLFDADPQCKDAARFFYGAGPDAQVILLGNVMTPEAIELLKNNYEVSKQANEKTQGQAARDEARKEQPPVTIKPEERSKLARWYGARVIETARKMINESVYKVNRHECRLKASILLGGYVAGGILPYEEAYNALAEVVSANTDNFEGAMQTVRDGLEYGQAEPITLERLEAESAEHRAAYFGSKQQASQEITPEQETIDPEVRRAAFRLLKQQATEQEEKTAYDRRRSTAGDFAAVSVLLSKHEFKDKARVAVQAFMGLCASKNNYNEFEFGYSELYPLLRRYDPDLFQRTDGKLEKKNVQRINGIVRPYIQAIKREQDRTGVLFIDITEGTSHTGPLGDKVFIKSEAKLPIWDYLDQIDFEAKLNPSYKRNSRRIRIEEARKLAQKLKPYKLPKKQEPTLYQQVEQALKQAGGNINRAIELLESAGYYDFRIRELLLKYLPPKAIDLLAGRAGGDPPPESQDADKSEFNGVASVDDLHFEPEESTAAAAGAGRNGHIEEQENIGVHSESGKSPKVQFMITHEMKQQLHDLGYPRDVVSKLKPEEASSIIEEDKTYVTWQAERDGHPLSTEEWEENLDSMTASVLTHY